MNDSVGRSVPGQNSGHAQRPIIDVERSLQRMGGDHALLHDLATFFLEDGPELLRTLESGLESRNRSQTARAAHSLSGLSANFSSESCATLGKSIEEACLKEDYATARAQFPTLRTQIAELIAALRTQVLKQS